MSVHSVNGSPFRREIDISSLTCRSVIKYRVLPAVCGLVFLTAAPWIHIGASIYLSPKPPVDKENCRCHCFDTVFRGLYEWAPSGYKPVYFNAVPDTLKILILTLIYVIITYEIIRHIVVCVMTSSLRKRMLLPVMAFIYPVYYNWWSFFNYINQQFHNYWYHDGFFAVTEIISLLYFVHFCDKSRQINATKILIPLTLNLTHIIVGGFDQFVENLFKGTGESFQRFRNLGLLIPDILIIVIGVYELYRLKREQRVPIHKMFYKEELGIAVSFCLMSAVLLSTIFSQ